MRECCTFPLKSSPTTGEVSSTGILDAKCTFYMLPSESSFFLGDFNASLAVLWPNCAGKVRVRPAASLTGFVGMSGLSSDHVNLEDFLAQWPQLLHCFSDPWLNACKRTCNVSDLCVRLQGEFSQRVSDCGFVFFPLLFTSQVVWVKKKNFGSTSLINPRSPLWFIVNHT